jgi:putative hydrolase of the HAD superfamily
LELRVIKGITFDCAGTLVEVRQNLAQILLGCASDLGIPVGWKESGIFEALYHARLPDFHRANRLGKDAVRAFYIHLAHDWLEKIGADGGRAESLQQAVEATAFGPNSPMFRAYEDATRCVCECRERGLRVGVVSNWDVSLADVLQIAGLSELIDFVVASLEFGSEKPDPAIFEFALAGLELAAGEVVHVGDDITDDVAGALSAGIRPVFLNRASPTVRGQSIQTLDDLFQELAWNG